MSVEWSGVECVGTVACAVGWFLFFRSVCLSVCAVGGGDGAVCGLGGLRWWWGTGSHSVFFGG